MPYSRKGIGNNAWNMIKQVAREAKAREAKARQAANREARPKTVDSNSENICNFWNCNVPIREDHVMCLDHYKDLQDGLINECPGCKRAKDAQYDLCLECNKKSQVPSGRASAPRAKSQRYEQEYSPAWDKGDAAADNFFVYILKLADGSFYAGQTRELRERLSEHRDDRVQSTARKQPKLVWFGIVPSRQDATSTEVELKKLVSNNPREIRRMIIRFQDLVRELDYD